MSVSTGQARLKEAEKDLLAHWQEVCQFWHDDNSRHFHDDDLAPLIVRIRAAQNAMMHMESVLNTIRRDCQ